MNTEIRNLDKYLIFTSPVLLFVLVLYFPLNSFASDTTVISQIVQQFNTKTSAWGQSLETYALGLFKICATLTVVLFGVRVALNRNNIGEILGQFVQTLLFCGFVGAVIVNYQEWTWDIINGLSDMASKVGSTPFDAADPLKTGLKIVTKILDNMSVWSPMESLGYIICALVIIITFALMTAQLVLIKCEAMVAMNASVILLGLGGAVILKDYAINVMKYVLSVAFKLYVLQLVMSLGLDFITSLDLQKVEYQDIVVAIAVSIILLSLVKTIPDVCAGIINGSHVGSGDALGSTVRTIVTATAAAGGAALGASMAGGRMTQAVSGAAKLASGDGKSGLSKLGHMASTLSSANKEARADAGRQSHSERMTGSVSKKIQEMKMRNMGGSGSSDSGNS